MQEIVVGVLGDGFNNDYYSVSVMVGNRPIDLVTWELVGQADDDRLRPLSPLYSQIDVVMLCFSVANPDTYESIKRKWLQEVFHYYPHTPLVLVGTKVDLRDNTKDTLTRPKHVTYTQGIEMAKQIGAVNYIECSAVTQKGVRSIFDEAIRLCLPACKKHRERNCGKCNGTTKKRCCIL